MSNINRSIKSPTKPYDPIAQLLALPHPPPVLKLGSTGKDAWAVRLLARLLAAHGHGSATMLDPAVLAPGVFTPDTVLTIHAFQKSLGFYEDFTAMPQVWAWLGCRDLRDPGEVYLAFARREAYSCAREIDGDNRGEYVQSYNGWQGPKAQWCAGFATWCVNQARQRLGLPAWDWGDNRLSSSALVKHASERSRLYVATGQSWAWERKHGQTASTAEPRKGDLCIVRGGGTHWRHTTVLDHVEGGRAYVIEGNVGNAVSWLTDAVWRALGRPAGIVRPGSYPLSQVVFVRTK